MLCEGGGVWGREGGVGGGRGVWGEGGGVWGERGHSIEITLPQQGISTYMERILTSLT